jgi:hypothetical protein
MTDDDDKQSPRKKKRVVPQLNCAVMGAHFKGKAKTKSFEIRCLQDHRIAFDKSSENNDNKYSDVKR